MVVLSFLVCFFDTKLTWRVHVSKVINKCKKVVNLLRCLAGLVYGPAAKSVLVKYSPNQSTENWYGSWVVFPSLFFAGRDRRNDTLVMEKVTSG